MAEIQMIDVWIPTVDQRWLILPRGTRHDDLRMTGKSTFPEPAKPSEDQFQSQLHCAVPTRSQHRIPASLVRCGTATAQNRGRRIIIESGAKAIRRPVRISEVGMVENVEELRSELGGEPLPQLPTLSHG